MKKNKITLMIMATVISTIVFVKSVNAAILNVPSATYPDIASAIAASSTGDTITVAAGTYTENLVIDKQLILQGAGSGNSPSVDTIIDASGGNYGILLETGGSSAAPADRQTIKDLRIINASLDGIRAFKSGGFNLDHVTLENLVITSNGGRGVELHNDTIVSDLEITNSELINNVSQGLRSSSGTPVDGLLITDSNFNGNTYGIYLQNNVCNVTILRSTFNNNSVWGAYMNENGTLTNLEIEGCQFTGNTNGYGIVFYTSAVAGFNGIIIRGSSFDNTGRGLWFGAAVISNVLIECSAIVNNVRTSTTSTYEGITFASGTLTNVVVIDSNIYGNNGRGVANNATGTVDVRDNWWGDASGPSGQGPGSGDAVTTNVVFDPWLPGPIDIGNCPIPVNVDIKPQFCPNPLNVKSKGVLPVAILGTDDFDVSLIDISTLKLNGITPVKNSFEDVTTPTSFEPCDCEGLGPDTYQDLTLKFDKQSIIAALGTVENGDVRVLYLTGSLLDGTAFLGKDCVVIKGVK